MAQVPEGTVSRLRHIHCIAHAGVRQSGPMLHDISVAIYITTAGFTLSGIVSNLYRLLAGADNRYGRTVYLAAMVVAGPNVLFEKAIAALREKRWPPVAFWLATAVACYWSLALGLFLFSIVLVL